MVKKKLVEFDLNLNSLKQHTFELNREFVKIDCKLSCLESSMKQQTQFNRCTSLCSSLNYSELESSSSGQNASFSGNTDGSPNSLDDLNEEYERGLLVEKDYEASDELVQMLLNKHLP